MWGSRSGLVAACALAAQLAVPCSAAADPPTLGKATTVTAAGAAGARVLLPADVRLGADDHSGRLAAFGVRFLTPARYGGLVLRSEQRIGGRRPTVTSYLLDRGARVYTHSPDEVLPSGTYRIFAFSDRPQMAIELELPALGGSARIDARAPVPLAFGAVPLVRRDGPTRIFGRFEDVDAEALVTYNFGFDFDGGPGRVETCFARGTADHGAAFASGCSGDTGTVSDDSSGDGEMVVREAGSVGIGGNFTPAGGDVDVDFVAAWLPVGTWDRMALPDPSAAPRSPLPRVERRVRVRNGRIPILLRCRSAGPRCAGVVALGTSRKAYAIKPGDHARVRFLPAPAQRSRLRRRGRTRVGVELTSASGERRAVGVVVLR